MAEYINKAELVGNLDKFAPEHFTPLLKSLIEKQPTADVVEVVRCKDCKHLSDSGGSYWCKETGFEMKSYELEHFCSYGERRETK